MAVEQKKRVSGVLLVDKPAGMTSQQVVSKVKYLYKSPAHDSKKAGHTGTLDPMATGLLPVCFGEATKFSHYQLNADKRYDAIVRLGAQTDTGDAEGDVIATAAVPAVDAERLAKVRADFLGEQQQLPPMYSALKKDGKKLYEYARAGITVEREPRQIVIKDLTLVLNAADELALSVTCSKGTYVRVLGEDIAKALGTLGHLTALRRTGVSDFAVQDALTLTALEEMAQDARLKQLLPVDACIEALPILVVDDEQAQRLGHGQRLNLQQEGDAQPWQAWFESGLPELMEVRLQRADGVFLGVGELAHHGRLQPTKLVAVS